MTVTTIFTTRKRILIFAFRIWMRMIFTEYIPGALKIALITGEKMNMLW